LEHPGAALAHTAILQYRPVNTDILPMFVIYHIFVRAASVAAAAGAERDPWRLVVALCARVRVRLDHPGLAEPVWFFNPLAWQLLIVLGAWWIIGGKRLRPWVTSRTLMVLAVLYLAFSLIITLSWSIKSLEPLVPQTLTNLLFQWTNRISVHYDCCIFLLLRFWRQGLCLTLGEG